MPGFFNYHFNNGLLCARKDFKWFTYMNLFNFHNISMRFFVVVLILHVRNLLVVAKAIWLENPCPYVLYQTASQCFTSVPNHILLVLINHHPLFFRPHQLLPMCLLGWIQWLWISVSCHSCTPPCRELWPTKFSRTEATRTIRHIYTALTSALRL